MISPLDPQTIPEGASKILTIGNFKLGKTIGIGSFGKVKCKLSFFFFELF